MLLWFLSVVGWLVLGLGFFVGVYCNGNVYISFLVLFLYRNVVVGKIRSLVGLVLYFVLSFGSVYSGVLVFMLGVIILVVILDIFVVLSLFYGSVLLMYLIVFMVLVFFFLMFVFKVWIDFV